MHIFTVDNIMRPCNKELYQKVEFHPDEKLKLFGEHMGATKTYSDMKSVSGYTRQTQIKRIGNVTKDFTMPKTFLSGCILFCRSVYSKHD